MNDRPPRPPDSKPESAPGSAPVPPDGKRDAPAAAHPPVTAEDADALRKSAFREGEGAFCAECEHALAGLPREGACPECGATYDESDVLRSAPRGAGRLALFLLAPFVAQFVVGFFAGRWGVMQGPTTQRTEEIFAAITIGVGVVGVVVGLVMLVRRFIRLARRRSWRRGVVVAIGALWLVAFFHLSAICWLGGCLVGAQQ